MYRLNLMALRRLVVVVVVMMAMVVMLLDLMRERILHGEEAGLFHELVPRDGIQKFCDTSENPSRTEMICKECVRRTR